MYFLLGLQKNLETLYALLAPYLPEGRPSGVELKRAYQRYLSDHQPLAWTSDRPGVEFVEDAERLAELSRTFAYAETAHEPERARDSGSFAPGEDLELVRAGFAHLDRLDPALGALAALVLNYVCCTEEPRVPGSGSLVAGLGTIYVNPLPSWTVEDVVECLVHELTHNLLWLDEHRYEHHRDYDHLLDAENTATSAILGEDRPLTVVFHSVVVAAEILELRRRLLDPRQAVEGVHGESTKVARQSLEAIATARSLPRLDELGSPRLLELLSLAEATLASHCTERV